VGCHLPKEEVRHEQRLRSFLRNEGRVVAAATRNLAADRDSVVSLAVVVAIVEGENYVEN
jgi:hypothetical protein